MTILTGTFYEDLGIFMRVSRRILLRIKNVLENICRENQDTHFMFNIFFYKKIVPFKR
jgi:hypothetical protein